MDSEDDEIFITQNKFRVVESSEEQLEGLFDLERDMTVDKCVSQARHIPDVTCVEGPAPAAAPPVIHDVSDPKQVTVSGLKRPPPDGPEKLDVPSKMFRFGPAMSEDLINSKIDHTWFFFQAVNLFSTHVVNFQEY